MEKKITPSRETRRTRLYEKGVKQVEPDGSRKNEIEKKGTKGKDTLPHVDHEVK